MIHLTGYLRGNLGRRIALLFFLCALVPILAFSIVTLLHARGQLAEQSRERLRLLGKESAQALLYRLHAASLEAGHWATVGPGADTMSAWFDEIRVAADPREPGGSIAGVPLPAIAETAELDRLARGGAVLRTASGRVLLARSLGPDPLGGIAWFAIAPDYLMGRMTAWGLEDARSPLPAGVESCLLSPEGPLAPCPAGLLRALESGTARDADDPRHFSWSGEDGERFAARRPVFLRAAFDAPSWEIVLSEPRDQAMAPARGFQRTFLLAALLSLLVVPFASQIQIRRNLEPLTRLEEGTRRIAERNFDSRVDIRSGDEFEQLAASFNLMAAQLGRQFEVLRTTNEIDRAILGEVRRDSILESLLARAPEVLPGAYVAVIVREADGPVHAHRGEGSERAHFLDSVAGTPTSLLAQAGLSDEDMTVVSSRNPEDGRIWTLYPVRPEGARAGTAGAVPAAVLIGTLGYPSDDDRSHAAHMADRLAVALANAKLVDELDRLNVETITAFARAIDAKSAWTAGHSERVTSMALRLAGELGLDSEDLELLRRGALLHDIGKIGVTSAILDKPGKLTDEEFALMRAHTTMGATILEPISGLRRIIPIARHHHERYDGKGYPDGLAGTDIPYFARIVSVADVFDALSSARPYRDAMPLERVVDILVGDSGTAFDPAVIEAFERVMRTYDRQEVA